MSEMLIIALVAVAGFLIFWGLNKAGEIAGDIGSAGANTVSAVGAEIRKTTQTIENAPAKILSNVDKAVSKGVNDVTKAGAALANIAKSEIAVAINSGLKLTGDANTSVTRIEQTGAKALSAAVATAQRQASAIVKGTAASVGKDVSSYKAVEYANIGAKQAAAAGIQTINPLLSFSLSAAKAAGLKVG